MATVEQIARASLQKITVQGGEADLEAGELQDFIFALNNWLLDLDARGIQLGFTQVTNAGENVTIPTGALRGVIANMAIEVAPDYGGVVTPELTEMARKGMKTIRILGTTSMTTSMPSTLPIGSGNECNNLNNGTRFYPNLEPAILAETTGQVSLEDETP